MRLIRRLIDYIRFGLFGEDQIAFGGSSSGTRKSKSFGAGIGRASNRLHEIQAIALSAYSTRDDRVS